MRHHRSAAPVQAESCHSTPSMQREYSRVGPPCLGMAFVLMHTSAALAIHCTDIRADIRRLVWF